MLTVSILLGLILDDTVMVLVFENHLFGFYTIELTY